MHGHSYQVITLMMLLQHGLKVCQWQPDLMSELLGVVKVVGLSMGSLATSLVTSLPQLGLIDVLFATTSKL